MKKRLPKKTVYYRSETDDFVTLSEKQSIKIDGSYKYSRDSLWQRLGDFIAYRLIATPLAYIFTKHKFHERFIGKEKLKEYTKAQRNTSSRSSKSAHGDGARDMQKGKDAPCGYFIYSNHTQQIADAFTPNMLVFPKKNSVIIDKNNLSLPLLGRHLKRLGGMPLPEDMRGTRSFIKEVQARISNGEAVTVYPEAHVWEYFTGVRNFPDSALDLPVRCGAPVFCATRAYRQNRFGKVVCDIYIDGPFFPDRTLSSSGARAKLRREVYSAMRERTRLSTAEVIKYVKKDNEAENADTSAELVGGQI